MKTYEELLASLQAPAQEWAVTENPTKGFSWKFFRALGAEPPAQGWKIHVSAAATTDANQDELPALLAKVLPFLLNSKVSFKLPASRDGVVQLNEGRGGASQVGKIVTIYPKDDAQALELARALDRLWPSSLGPAVPGEARFRKTGAVSLRYGSFAAQYVEDDFGRPERMICDKNGALTLDALGNGNRNATELDPALLVYEETLQLEKEILTEGRRFLPLKLLRKGFKKVYCGIEITPLRSVIFKTIPRGGASAGALKNEFEILTRLSALNPAASLAPKALAYIPGELNVLIVEEVGGQNLAMASFERQLPALPRLARQVAELHDRGFVHRDLKLENVVLDGNDLRLIDFEAAAYEGEAHPQPLGTFNHTPPEGKTSLVTKSYDCYALGVCIAHVLLQRNPSLFPAANDVLLELLRFKGYAKPVIDLVAACTAADPESRPAAREIANRLSELDFKTTQSPLQTSSHELDLQKTGLATRGFLAAKEVGAWRNDHMSPEYLFEGINLGASGIILGLLALDQHARQNVFIDDVAAAARRLARHDPQPFSHGLFTGNAGVALALAAAAKTTGEKDFLLAARSRIFAAIESCRENDFFSGKAGVIFAATQLSKFLSDEEYLARAQGLVENLLRSAEINEGVIGWRGSGRLEKGSGEFYTGAAHGASGIAAALAVWAKATGEAEVRRFAVDVFKGIWLKGRTEDGTTLQRHISPRKIPAFQRAWCHGTLGYLWSILLSVGDDPNLTHEIDETVQMLASPVPFENPTYCHGLSGELELWRMLGAVERHRGLAEKQADEAAALLQLLAQKDKSGAAVWHSEEPLTRTPDLWIGFLGPATALALWREKSLEAFLARI